MLREKQRKPLFPFSPTSIRLNAREGVTSLLNCSKLDTVKNSCFSVYLIKGEERSSEGVKEVDALATLIESEMLQESVIEVA